MRPGSRAAAQRFGTEVQTDTDDRREREKGRRKDQLEQEQTGLRQPVGMRLLGFLVMGHVSKTFRAELHESAAPALFDTHALKIFLRNLAGYFANAVSDAENFSLNRLFHCNYSEPIRKNGLVNASITRSFCANLLGSE